MARSILIVDDNHLIRRMLRAWIEQNAEWQICGEAENGRVAVERVKELHPELVILDLHMPVMNGMDAAREISQVAPGTKIIMFTIHSSEQLLKEAQAIGVFDVVSKCDLIGGHLLSALRHAATEARRSVYRRRDNEEATEE